MEMSHPLLKTRFHGSLLFMPRPKAADDRRSYLWNR
jgi:hypothetical protein